MPENALHHAHLPRLTAGHYRGTACVHWSHSVCHREQGWCNDRFHAQFREALLHACARYRLLCPVYCVMPDHVHHVWIGFSPASDQRRACALLREHTGKAMAPAAWQKQPFDHVLREQERTRGALQRVCFYVQENPVRANLVKTWSDYAYTGCVIPGYPEFTLNSNDFWLRFWRVHAFLRKAEGV